MLPLLLAVTGSLLLTLYWIYRLFWTPLQFFSRLGIKGPKPELVFGNLRLMSRGPLKFLDSMIKKYGPVIGFYSGTKPFLLIADLEILKYVMVKDFESFMDRPEVPMFPKPSKRVQPGLLQSKGEKWKVARRTLSPTFSAAKMKSMVPLITNSVKGLLKNMQNIANSNQSADVFRMFGSFTMETIVATAFGRVTDIQGGENDELVNAASTIFKQATERRNFVRYLIIDQFPLLAPLIEYFASRTERGKAYMTLTDIAMGLVRSRRQEGHQGKYKDFLQLMIDASVQEGEEGESCPVSDKKLTDDQIVAFSRGFLLAGYETTANTLSFTAYLLALNPDIQEKLQSDIDNYMDDNPDLYEAAQDIGYLEMVIQESLRLYPPGAMVGRFCQKTVTINGLTIPEGVSVIIPIAHLHKDPQYWEEPEKFNPERFTPEEKAKRPQLCYIPFGHGPRNCIGMRFAMLEAKLALIEVLRKFTFVKAPDTEVPLETVVGITMAPKNGIFIKVVSRD